MIQKVVQIKRHTGFTLLEIMLVLVVLSLGAVAVVINLPLGQQGMAEEEARRFYHRLLLLNENAILNGRDYGIRFEPSAGRYQFLELTREGWIQAELKQSSERVIEEGLTMSFSLGSSAWNKSDSLFDDSSLFDDEMFADLEDEKNRQQKPPQIFVFSSGEVTPFSLQLAPEDKSQQWQVSALETGVIEILAADEISSEVR